jgi:hypothetical protein
MVEMFELCGHCKWCLTATVDLRRFSAKSLAPAATGDLAVPSLIHGAGASNSVVAGGDFSIITDVASSLLRLSVGERSHDKALDT